MHLSAPTNNATPPKLPPGPPPRTGGLIETLRYFSRFATDPVGFIGERFQRYGDIYYAPSKDGGLYVLRHPDHLAEVLMTRAKHYRKTHTAFDRLGDVLGRGLLTTDGDAWKRHRRMLQPAFSKSRLAVYGDVMTSETNRTLLDFRDGQHRDISRDMMALTLRIVSRSLFNHDVRSQTDSVTRAMHALNESFSRPPLLPAWVPTLGRLRSQRALAGLDALVYRLIDARRIAIDRGDPTPDDMLQALVTAVDHEGDGTGLGRSEIRDQLVTFFLAGHETTSHSLTWSWYLLAQNPKARAALHRELDEVLDDREPTHEDLAALRYTEQVLLEAMRLFPPAYVLARRAQTDTEIAGYPVPAGSEVVLWTYHTHRDPRWFPDPEAFRPERFAPETASARPKLAYLPFGAGPRACIGQQFSLLESKLVLATIARRYTLDLVPSERILPKFRVTLAPKNGMPMQVRVRPEAHR
jgi:cytochrome P450